MSTINYDLQYRDNGEKKTRIITIEFASNRLRKKISQYFQDFFQVKFNWDRISDIVTLIAAIYKNKEEGYKEEIFKLTTEKETLTQEILKHNNTGLITKNVELLIELLASNGYKDENLLSFDWWDNNTEPNSIIEILNLTANKDIDKKKTN